MLCTIAAEQVLPSDFSDYLTDYLLRAHRADLVAVLDDQNPSTSKHHSIAVK